MTKYQKFIMTEVYEKLLKAKEEYNSTKSTRNECITEIVFNKKTGCIAICFQTYSYLIFVYKNGYHVAWHHKDEKNPYKFIQDGIRMFEDSDELIDCLRTFISSAFNPQRGEWWQFCERPEKYAPKKHHRK